MKSFTSVQLAIGYHVLCPLCNSPLDLARRGDYSSSFEYNVHKISHKITFPLGFGDDELTLDLINEKVELTVFRSVTQPIYTSNIGQVSGYIAGTGPSSYTGYTYRGLTVECKDCLNFSFTIQLVVDISNKTLTDRFLNSEHVIYTDENKTIHDIKNVYSTEQTHYTSFLKGEKEITSIIPLVPLNLKNPPETIARIKKLLIFA